MLGSSKKYFFITLLLSFLSLIYQAATLPVSDAKKSPAVYRRYIRKRPSIYADDEFMEEVVEHFYVAKRPPMFAFSDEDINLIIKCDFNPEYKDCPKLKSKNKHPMSLVPTTLKPQPTTQALPHLPNIPIDEEEHDKTETPPAEFPQLPEIPIDEEDQENLEPSTEDVWSSEQAVTTEAEPNFDEEGSGDEFDQDEEVADEW